MKPIYVRAESMVKPPEIEVGVTTVYLRRNFAQMEHSEMDSETPFSIWTYDEAALTKDEALLILSERQISMTQTVEDFDAMNVDQEYRLTLLELGLTGDDI